MTRPWGVLVSGGGEIGKGQNIYNISPIPPPPPRITPGEGGGSSWLFPLEKIGLNLNYIRIEATT